MSSRPQLVSCPGLQASEGDITFLYRKVIPLPGEGAFGTVIKPPLNELTRKFWLGGLPWGLYFSLPPMQNGDAVALVPSPPIHPPDS